MDATTTIPVAVRVADDGATDDDLASLTRSLQRELSNLELERVELVTSGEAPSGSKAVDPITLGALAIAILPNAIPKMIEFLDHWVSRRAGRTITIKAKINGEDVELQVPASNLEKLNKILETVKSASSD